MQALDTSSIWEEASEFRGLQWMECWAKQISRSSSERYWRKCAESATKQMVYRPKTSIWTDQCQYRSDGLWEAEPLLASVSCSNFSELPSSPKSLAGTGSYVTRGRDIVNLNWTQYQYEVRGYKFLIFQVQTWGFLLYTIMIFLISPSSKEGSWNRRKKVQVDLHHWHGSG